MSSSNRLQYARKLENVANHLNLPCKASVSNMLNIIEFKTLSIEDHVQIVKDMACIVGRDIQDSVQEI